MLAAVCLRHCIVLCGRHGTCWSTVFCSCKGKLTSCFVTLQANARGRQQGNNAGSNAGNNGNDNSNNNPGKGRRPDRGQQQEEQPKVEQPKPEPKAEQPKFEMPKIDIPKFDEPKKEEPKVGEFSKQPTELLFVRQANSQAAVCMTSHQP